MRLVSKTFLQYCESPAVWYAFDTLKSYTLDVRHLKFIFRHAKYMSTLNLSDHLILSGLLTTDRLFSKFLSTATSMVLLDLSNAKVSSVGFIKYMTKLRFLLLRNCHNVGNSAVAALTSVNSLDQIDISNTQITAENVRKICLSLNLVSCDSFGIQLRASIVEDIITSRPNMISLGFTPFWEDQEKYDKLFATSNVHSRMRPS